MLVKGHIKLRAATRQTVHANKIKRPPEGGLFSVPNQLTNAAGSGQIS